MDDLKLYASNDNQLTTLINITKSFSDDIKMSFSDDIKMPFSDDIKMSFSDDIKMSFSDDLSDLTNATKLPSKKES